MKNLQITNNFKWFIIPTVLILVIGVVFFAIQGMNLGIDFTGGTMYTIEMNGAYNISDIEAIVDKNVDVGFRVSASGDTGVMIQLQDANADANEMNEVREKLNDELKAAYPDMSEPTVERVGAVAGAEMVRNALLALAIACLGMLIYITIRFEFWSSIAALIGLLHDVCMMICFVIIFRIQVNSSFIAAVLTIVGYSINNTIVVFDRVRDNRKRFGKSMSRGEIVDKSVRETLTRSINTAFTTLLTVGMLCILGVTSIREFTLPIIVGLICGTYSSVLLVGPLWVLMQKRSDKSAKPAKKAKKN